MLAKCAEPKAPTDVYFCTACYEGWRAFQNETISIDLCKIDENGDVKLDWRTKNFYRVRMVYFLASYAPEAA